jgi:hypothetical protein
MTFTQSESRELFKWADELPQSLWDDLGAVSPRQAAENTGADWDGANFLITLLGKRYALDPREHRIWIANRENERVSYQAGVVLLYTLSHSQGVPPSGRMKTPQELPGGILFFTGAHALATGPLEKKFGADPDGLLARAVALGGERTSGADMAVVVPGLPRVPLYVLLWTADSDFDARAVIGIDDRAIYHLDLGAIFALTNLLVSRLTKDHP